MIRSTARYVATYLVVVALVALTLATLEARRTPTPMGAPTKIDPCAMVTERDASTHQVIKTYCIGD